MDFPIDPSGMAQDLAVGGSHASERTDALRRRDLRRELPRAQLCPTATQKNRSRLAVGIDLSDMECDESGQRRIFVHSRTHAAPTVSLTELPAERTEDLHCAMAVLLYKNSLPKKVPRLEPPPLPKTAHLLRGIPRINWRLASDTGSNTDSNTQTPVVAAITVNLPLACRLSHV